MHFRKENDVKILLLMYHYKISVNSHILYIELSRYYEKTNLEISKFILQKAIKRNVQDKEIILKEYARLKNEKGNFMSESEIYRIINPKKLFLWGKEWICNEEIIVNKIPYDLSELEFMCKNLEDFNETEVKIFLYEKENQICINTPENTLVKKSLSLHFNLTDLQIEDEFEKNILGKNDEEKIKDQIKHMFDSSIIDENINEKENFDDNENFDVNSELSVKKQKRQSICYKNIKSEEFENENIFIKFKGKIQINEYVEINEFVYHIQKNLSDKLFSLKRIVKVGKDNLTIKSNNKFLIKEINQDEIDIIYKFFIKKEFQFNFTPEFIFLAENEECKFALFTDKEFLTLKNVFILLIQDSGLINEELIAYYYLKIYKIINVLKKNNLYVNHLSEDSFLIDKNNNLLLNSFHFTSEKISDCSIFENLLNYCELDKYFYLKNDFNIEKLEEDLKNEKLEEALLNQKLVILENH